MKYCLVNYRLKLEKEAKISINERGFLFGDGVFETFRFIEGKIDNFLVHKKRLEAGLKSIQIDFDLSDLEKNIQKLINKNLLKNGLVRIYISRGVGSAGYAPKPNIKPLIVIQTRKLPKIPAGPVKLWVSSVLKISNQSLPIHQKLAANGLNSTLAKMEAMKNSCFDALMLDQSGLVCETSSANIFWAKNGTLYTPSNECDILLGTTRQKIINMSQFPVKEVKAGLDELLQAEEIFVSNVSFGILKIDKILPHLWQTKSDQYFHYFKEKIN